MSNRQVFEGSTMVHIQGPTAMFYVGHDDQHVELGVNGFHRRIVRIVDCRPETVKAIQFLRKTGIVTKFANVICQPAQATVTCSGRKITIKLEPTKDSACKKRMLWIAVNVGSDLPAYDILFYKAYAMPEADKFSWLVIYNRP